jgi:hypothetical protein
MILKNDSAQSAESCFILQSFTLQGKCGKMAVSPVEIYVDIVMRGIARPGPGKIRSGAESRHAGGIGVIQSERASYQNVVIKKDDLNVHYLPVRRHQNATDTLRVRQLWLKSN